MSTTTTTTTEPETTTETKPTPPPFNHFPAAQKTFAANLPLIANNNAYLGDIASTHPLKPSESTTASTTSPPTSTPEPNPALSAGFYRLDPGPPLVYTYTYHEMKIILSGDFEISCEETGQSVGAKAGDVFQFMPGQRIVFKTEGGGLAFYTGARKEGAA